MRRFTLDAKKSPALPGGAPGRERIGEGYSVAARFSAYSPSLKARPKAFAIVVAELAAQVSLDLGSRAQLEQDHRDPVDRFQSVFEGVLGSRLPAASVLIPVPPQPGPLRTLPDGGDARAP